MNFAQPIDFACIMEPVAVRLLGEPNLKLSNPPHDVRFGSRGSISTDFVNGRYYDHETKRGGGVLDLISYKTGRNRDEAQGWLKREGLLNAPLSQTTRPTAPVRQLGKIAATYDYIDENSNPLFQVVRFDPKDFRQRHPARPEDDPARVNNGWVWGVRDTRPVPYHLPDLIKGIAAGRRIFVTEGEKDADNLRVLGFVATTNPGGASKWRQEFSAFFKDSNVVLVADNDEAGRSHVEQVATFLHGTADEIRILDVGALWSDCPPKGDVSDWIAALGNDPQEVASRLKEVVKNIAAWVPASSAEAPSLSPATLAATVTALSGTDAPRLLPISLKEFLTKDIKPREMLLDPILPQKGLAMLYATRGTGKTLVALGMAYALATGTRFLKWRADKARRVLLVDGEMPAAELQKRLSWHALGTNTDPGDHVKILCGDLIELGGIGNVGSETVQAELEPHLAGIDLLILDNLSTLTAVVRDNDAESWGPIQDYLLRLRRRNISVLIVHHAGKGGQQRGTSRREDVLDTVISLRRPSDYEPTEGARFEVHIEKGRGMTGDALKPFEAKFEVRDNAAVWTTREIEDAKRAEILMLHEDGMSVRKIAEAMAMPKTTVHRILKSTGALQAEAGKDGE